MGLEHSRMLAREGVGPGPDVLALDPGLGVLYFAAERGDVHELVLYGRPDPTRGGMRLAEAIREAIRSLPASLAGRVVLLVECDEEVQALASRSQVELLLGNLLSNAALSIPGGRAGRVEVRAFQVDDRTVRVVVRHDGVGRQVRGAFDPFYTTRAPGEGMELGLPICQAIAIANVGSLTVTSAPGQASTFRLELPTPAVG